MYDAEWGGSPPTCERKTYLVCYIQCMVSSDADMYILVNT